MRSEGRDGVDHLFTLCEGKLIVEIFNHASSLKAQIFLVTAVNCDFGLFDSVPFLALLTCEILGVLVSPMPLTPPRRPSFKGTWQEDLQ